MSVAVVGAWGEETGFDVLATGVGADCLGSGLLKNPTGTSFIVRLFVVLLFYDSRMMLFHKYDADDHAPF
jgi:hypothetical protein